MAIADHILTGNELLDNTLNLITDSHKNHKPAYWLNTIATKKLARRIADQLVTKNVLTLESKMYLWVKPFTGTDKNNASIKYWIKQQLRGIILAGEKPTSEDVALLNLLRTCSLINLVFTRDERRWAIMKIDELLTDDLLTSIIDVWGETDSALNTLITRMTSH